MTDDLCMDGLLILHRQVVQTAVKRHVRRIRAVGISTIWIAVKVAISGNPDLLATRIASGRIASGRPSASVQCGIHRPGR